MAKSQKRNEDAGVRILYTEIFGSDETVQSAISQFAAAVRPSLEREKRIVQVITAANLDDPEEIASRADEILEAELESPVEELEDSEKPDDRSRPKRKARNYSFIKELNLRPSNNSALAEFVGEKRPKDQQERFAVILYYLKNILQIEKVGPNHMYTAWKELGGVKVPLDLAQTARTIANRKNWFDTSDTNDLKVTVTGENFVEHDLPAKAQQM